MRRGPRHDRRAAPAAAAGATARLLLSALLLATPLLFLPFTLEAFEFPKSLLVLAAALACLPQGLPAAQRHLAGGGWRRLGREPLAAGLLMLLLSATLSTLGSLSPRRSFFGAHESYAGWLTLAALVTLFFAIRAACRSVADFAPLLRALGLAAVLAAAYGLVQALGLDPVPWDRRAHFAGVWRVHSTLGQPTFLGGFLAAALPLLAWLAWSAARAGRRRLAAAWALAVPVALAALALTFSRGAWLASAGAAFVGLWGLFRMDARAVGRRAAVLLAAALVVGALALSGSASLRRVAQALAQRVSYSLPVPGERPDWALPLDQEPRLLLWASALRIWREHPLLGTGPDTFQLAYPRHRQLAVWNVEGPTTPQHAHDQYLQVLATQGLLGLGALALVGLGLWRALREGLAGPERALALVVAAALTAVALHLLLSLAVVSISLLAVVLAALADRLAGPAPQLPDPGPGSASAAQRAARAAGALAALAGLLGLVAWPLAADWHSHQAARAEAAGPGRGEAHLRAATGLTPWRDVLWLRRGAAHLGAADGPGGARAMAEARLAFETACRLEPLNAYHHLALGRALAAAARASPPAATPEEVRAPFARALELDPRNPFLWAQAGRAELQLGDAERVRLCSQRCRALDPRYGACTWLLGQSGLDQLARSGLSGDERARRLESLGEHLKRAARAQWYNDPDGQAAAAAQAAAAMLATNRLGEGFEMALLAVSKAPDLLPARRLLLEARERMGDAAGAEAEREAVRRLEAAGRPQ